MQESSLQTYFYGHWNARDGWNRIVKEHNKTNETTQRRDLY